MYIRYMNNLQFITDSKGNQTHVLLPLKAYEKLLEDSEMKADIAAYLKAKRNPGKMVPMEEAFKELDAHWAKQK